MIDKSPEVMTAVCSENKLRSRLRRLGPRLFGASGFADNSVCGDPFRPCRNTEPSQAAEMMSAERYVFCAVRLSVAIVFAPTVAEFAKPDIPAARVRVQPYHGLLLASCRPTPELLPQGGFLRP